MDDFLYQGLSWKSKKSAFVIGPYSSRKWNEMEIPSTVEEVIVVEDGPGEVTPNGRKRSRVISAMTDEDLRMDYPCKKARVVDTGYSPVVDSDDDDDDEWVRDQPLERVTESVVQDVGIMYAYYQNNLKEEECVTAQYVMEKQQGDKMHKCPLCPYYNKRKSCLKGHEMNHTGEKPYACPLCSFSCKTNWGLTRHKRIHTGEKPYKCTFCSFRSLYGLSVERHIRTHTGEKPYKCSFCPYSAARSGTLKLHQLNHTGEKPFKCSLCTSSFTRKPALAAHLRTHTGEKPFKCSFCQYACAQKGYIKIHERIHTGEKPYLFCSSTFTSKQNLRNHVVQHIQAKTYM